MKNLILIFCLLSSPIINAQNIEYNQFSEGRMNEVIFNKINANSLSNGRCALMLDNVAQDKIYTCLKKMSDRHSMDEIGTIINRKTLKEYDTPAFLPICLLDSLDCRDFKTYEEVAGQCITNWRNNPSDALFLGGWGTVVCVTTFENKKNKTIFICIAYLR